ncbi:hypothetical protein SPSIL_052050 [Sporomusa silvacetica DSM 10669]|uniref:DNA-binding protein n=1 Tax=Sporomusa silvacetica DSM 10669 TaxID=1123289 RepID=A0ABZ3ITH1_9FIRM|nr:hypothetical protein [Sporomusa silvacetica]OZC22312.1 hypothetical protein SPSIL_06180 [Sporomusa silvacetica DSM 10669]
MENIVNLNILPKEGDKIMKVLADGNMVVARSKNDFLYILKFDDEYHLFSHSPGSPRGSQKRFPKDEKYTAIIRNLANLADYLFMVEFNKDLNIYGVMCSAEEGILNMFPGDDRDADADIEFVCPNQEKQDNNSDNTNEHH